MMDKAIEGIEGLGDFIDQVAPMGRMALPEEVADAVIFLCSYRSSYVNGIGFILDGGATLTALR